MPSGNRSVGVTVHGDHAYVADDEAGIHVIDISDPAQPAIVGSASLPDGVTETHVSLFDGSNCGLAVDGKPVFSVQHHPEASPGPQDSYYLFERFVKLIEDHKAGVSQNA